MNQFTKTIPSLLSSLRLVAALAFPFCPERHWGVLVIAAGLSDVIDGWLARRLNAESWQGGLIDAIADKLFVTIALIVYASSDKFNLFWLPFLLSRDLYVLFTVLYITWNKKWYAFKAMEARISGKIATGGQFILFLTVIFVPKWVAASLFLASFCSIISAIDYSVVFRKKSQSTA